MMILLHKADNPSEIPARSLTTLTRGAVRRNRPPSARIDGAGNLSVRVGARTSLTGAVADEDGPQQPLPVWDLGDGSELRYGKSVEHVHDRPGAYTEKACPTAA